MQLDSNPDAELEERRRLGSGEHCDDCLELEGEGLATIWVFTSNRRRYYLWQ